MFVESPNGGLTKRHEAGVGEDLQGKDSAKIVRSDHDEEIVDRQEVYQVS
jgi:hypothetical protein